MRVDSIQSIDKPKELKTKGSRRISQSALMRQEIPWCINQEEIPIEFLEQWIEKKLFRIQIK